MDYVVPKRLFVNYPAFVEANHHLVKGSSVVSYVFRRRLPNVYAFYFLHVQAPVATWQLYDIGTARAIVLIEIVALGFQLCTSVITAMSGHFHHTPSI